MDPDKNLKDQLDLANDLLEEDDDEKSLRLAELVLDLNEWILKGGFLPKDWNNNLRGN
jgi:hypothetical protein